MLKIKNWLFNVFNVLFTITTGLILLLLVNMVIGLLLFWWIISAPFYIVTGINPDWVDWKDVNKEMKKAKNKKRI